MFSHRLDRLDLIDGRIELRTVSGGRATAQLVSELFARHFQPMHWLPRTMLRRCRFLAGHIAVSTDSSRGVAAVLSRWLIGDLAVNGSVNDVAMAGADPIALTIGFILKKDLAARSGSHLSGALHPPAHKLGFRSSAATPKWK